VASENGDIERRLWAVADQLRANSGLKPSEYSRPVLGLLFCATPRGGSTAGVDIKRTSRITAVDGPFLALTRIRLEVSNRSIRALSSEQIF
jgi:hypothetical protein